jgi:peptidoglycan/xylan/chitin deacetylase (PgdA/CDA1 family)
MRNYDVSHWSVTDRFGHRVAAYLRTNVKPMRNTRPIVSFTFDDVPESAYSKGADILDAHGVNGTFYIAGGLCDTQEPHRRLIARHQCRDLASRGHEIGCHTFSHCKVNSLSDQDLDLELERNQSFFVGLDPGIVLENFAYPYNLVSPRAKLRLQRRFHSCRAGGQAINIGSVDLCMLKSTEICEGVMAVDGIAAWIDQTVASKGWLIFLTHDVSAYPGKWGCSPQLLAAAVSFAVARGCKVLSVREALQEVY